MLAQPHRQVSPLAHTLRGGTYAFLALVTLAAIWAPTTAQARDMSGKGGVGLLVPTSEVLGRTPVIALRYWRQSIAVEAMVGYDWLRSSSGDDDTSNLHAGAGMTWKLVDGARLSAGVGGRLWMQYRSNELTTINNGKKSYDIQNDLGLLLELLLVAEWFVSDHLGISAGVGPSIFVVSSFAPTSRTDSGIADLLGTKASRGGSLIELGGRYGGGIGLQYYF